MSRPFCILCLYLLVASTTSVNAILSPSPSPTPFPSADLQSSGDNEAFSSQYYSAPPDQYQDQTQLRSPPVYAPSVSSPDVHDQDVTLGPVPAAMTQNLPPDTNYDTNHSSSPTSAPVPAALAQKLPSDTNRDMNNPPSPISAPVPASLTRNLPPDSNTDASHTPAPVPTPSPINNLPLPGSDSDNTEDSSQLVPPEDNNAGSGIVLESPTMVPPQSSVVVPSNYSAEDESYMTVQSQEDTGGANETSTGIMAGVLLGVCMVGLGGFVYKKIKSRNKKLKYYEIIDKHDL